MVSRYTHFHIFNSQAAESFDSESTSFLSAEYAVSLSASKANHGPLSHRLLPAVAASGTASGMSYDASQTRLVLVRREDNECSSPLSDTILVARMGSQASSIALWFAVCGDGRKEVRRMHVLAAVARVWNRETLPQRCVVPFGAQPGRRPEIPA
jgi:hypothetical protein